MSNDKKKRIISATDFLYAKASHYKVPLHGTFELSPVCNFNCKMCYVRKSTSEVRNSPRAIMTLEQWRQIAKQAKEAGTLFLLLTGGEPLLWPDFWTLYDELIDMGFLVSINTNGSLIDAEAVSHFSRKPPYKINITLYGASDESYFRLCGVNGVFDKVDSAIRSLLKAGIMVKLNCSLTPDNAEDLDRIINYAKRRKTVLAVSTYMLPPVRRDPTMTGCNIRFDADSAAYYMMHSIRKQRGEQEYQQYMLDIILKSSHVSPGVLECDTDAEGSKLLCKAGKSSFWITWDGWMTPCGMMPEPKEDLRATDFSTAWKNIIVKTSELKLSGVCSKCHNRKFCRNCAAIAYAETGTTSGVPKYLCRMAQQIVGIAYNNPSKISKKAIYRIPHEMKEEMK